jgi:heme/copper-type cytochrome/quinol oxidase subunit 1
MDSPMLGAKLFFLCGLVFLVAGFIERPAGLPSIDIMVHATYFVVSQLHLMLLSSFVLWFYAGLYYLGVRLFGLDFSPILMIVHLSLTATALIGLNSIRYLGIYGVEHPPASPLLFRLAPASGVLLLIGAALFVVVILLATVARVRRAAI